ncbi:MAG TPA: hypothetical protein VGP20_07480 [Steroidobacteraceae bacterium]|jgi:hypothetical protein|nr:hypothetical protein [Steroidobacteraceae bacterium]
MLAIEADIEAPEKSKMFTEYPRITADHHMIECITDCLRLIVGGNLACVGLSSSVLFDKSNPRTPVNRRISIIVMTQQLEEAAQATDAAPGVKPGDPPSPVAH